MAFKQASQKFNAAINTVEIGSGEKKVVLGGEKVLPFYTFDEEIVNSPKVGVEISDLGLEGASKGIVDYYGGATEISAIAAKAGEMPGADFICLRFEGADPNGVNKSVEECVETAKAVSEACDLPLVVAGCDNVEKDAQILEKVAEVLQGKNILVLSAKEENYKKVAASAGMAYKQKVAAESSVDINLAKQLNVLMTQLGSDPKNIVMNLGSATVGYGFEYVSSTMDRVKMAALSQNDTALQMPIITPVASETWSAKESIMPEEDMPEWGSQEDRGIDMEVVTAVACLASGSNAVILKHPKSVATVSKLIKELM